MITGRDIVVLSSTAWDSLWEANHELSTRFARAGNRVFYVEHMGFRAPRLRQAGRVFRYLRRWAGASRALGRREVTAGLHVSTPIVLPPFGGPLQRMANRKLFLPVIGRAASRIGITDPIVITYVPTDAAADLVELLATPRSTVVAYWVADYAEITSHQARLRASEHRLLRRADLVLAQAQSLADHCAQRNGNVHVMSHGVDMDAFPMYADSGQTPAELAGLPGPLVGYMGGLHAAVDYALLDAVTRLRPQWTWVFVGDARVPQARLPKLRNVVHLGHRPHAELIHYLRRFDVCIVPYREDASTAPVFPTKLHEYLAAGRPVVSTRLPAVVEYQQRHPVFATAAAEPNAFTAAIERALQDADDHAAALQRRSAAACDDWNLRMEQISSLILDAGRTRSETALAPAARARVTV